MGSLAESSRIAAASSMPGSVSMTTRRRPVAVLARYSSCPYGRDACAPGLVAATEPAWQARSSAATGLAPLRSPATMAAAKASPAPTVSTAATLGLVDEASSLPQPSRTAPSAPRVTATRRQVVQLAVCGLVLGLVDDHQIASPQQPFRQPGHRRGVEAEQSAGAPGDVRYDADRDLELAERRIGSGQVHALQGERGVGAGVDHDRVLARLIHDD